MNKISFFLTQFLEHLKTKKGLSARTIRNYAFYLKRFLEFAKINQAEEITLAILQAYQIHLKQLTANGKKLSAATQNYHLIALRGWLRYLKNQQASVVDPGKIKLVKVRRQINRLTNIEIEKILAAPLKSGYAPIVKLRDKAILELICGSGLKVSQLVSLSRKSFNFSRSRILLDNHREIVLSNQAGYWLKQYLAKRLDDAPALFVRYDRAMRRIANSQSRSMNLTPRSIQRLVEKYAALAGLTKYQITPETLRKIDIFSK